MQDSSSCDEELVALEKVVKKLLDKAMAAGIVIVITNSVDGWVRFLPDHPAYARWIAIVRPRVLHAP